MQSNNSLPYIHMSDHYKILQVSNTAASDEIKKAYRQLALKWHPDRNKAPDASNKFKEISNAYQVLSDPKKRRDYDLCRRSGQFFECEYVDPFFIFQELLSFMNGVSGVFNGFNGLIGGGVRPGQFVVETIIIADMSLPFCGLGDSSEFKKINTAQKPDQDSKWKTKIYPDGTVQKIMNETALQEVLKGSVKRIK